MLIRNKARFAASPSLVAAALAAALVGGATTSSSAAGRVSAPRCVASQLRLKLGPLVSEKTEQHTATFALTNMVRSGCSLDGYPTVTLTDAVGRLLPFTYGHHGDQMITAAPPTPVRVPGGGSAYFELNKNACVSFTRRVASEINVRLPGSQRTLSLRLPHYPLLDYCPPGEPGDGITVSPLEPTLTAAACRSQRACGSGVRRSALTGALPPAGSVVGTIRVSVREGTLYTARGNTLFLITFPEQHATSITVERVDSTGVRWRRVRFPLAYYLMDLSAGTHGVYAGTSVIKRFTNVPDVLLRFDPATLAVRARASFPARIAALESGDRMWASIGDGRVVRLDPTSLGVLATRRLFSARSAAMHDLGLSKPALGLGSLWVLAGGGTNTELVRMDPATLAVRSRIHIPLGKPVTQVIGNATHVYLVAPGIVAVDASGRLGRLNPDTELDAATTYGDGVVGLNDAKLAVELLNTHGRVTASTPVRDLGGEIAVSGANAWFLGNAGSGNGIVHVRLAARSR
jgi:Domain of unknown function (DUF4232)